MYFVLVGSHNQLYTFHTLVNLLVTILFYFTFTHDIGWPKQQAIKKILKNQMACCKVVMWSVGHTLSDVTSASSRSPNKPIRRNQKHRSVYLNHSYADRKLRSFGGLEKSVWPSNKCATNLPESLRCFVKTSRSCTKNRLENDDIAFWKASLWWLYTAPLGNLNQGTTVLYPRAQRGSDGNIALLLESTADV